MGRKTHADRGMVVREPQPTVLRAEYDDNAGERANRRGPLTLDDYDRADEHLALRGLRTSARRRARADEMASPKKGARWMRVLSEGGVGSVEVVAMVVGVVALVTILGATAYRMLGCERGGDCVSRYLRLP